MNATAASFDPVAKARELVEESTSWDTTITMDAEPGDVPFVDVERYFSSKTRDDLDADEGLGDFGIPPHVDTTFFTLLLQDSPGLTIYSTRRDAWVNAPHVDNAYVVNTGELLRQWTNDRFLSVRHFANNHTGVTDNGAGVPEPAHSRYSIPFFFNATADYPMECIPTCCGPDNPARYPPVSYRQSQAVVQGE